MLDKNALQHLITSTIQGYKEYNTLLYERILRIIIIKC